jgi:hypothetical protein
MLPSLICYTNGQDLLPGQYKPQVQRDDVNSGGLEKTPAAKLANEKVSLSRKNTITHLPTAVESARAAQKWRVPQ